MRRHGNSAVSIVNDPNRTSPLSEVLCLEDAARSAEVRWTKQRIFLGAPVDKDYSHDQTDAGRYQLLSQGTFWW